MSAFICNKSHINAMVTLALSARLTWYHDGTRFATHETANQIGQMLLDENVRAISHRYQDNAITNLPGPANGEWLIPFNFHIFCRVPTPVQAIKLITCYEYQACENPDWETTEAKTFCAALRDDMISKLPGYEEAPWEWEDSHYYETEVKHAR